MKKTTFLSFLLCLLTSCSQLTVDNTPIGELDLNQYLGDWYEVARFDHRFERGMEQTRANYTLRDDGKIIVLNSGIKNGKPKTAQGKAKVTETPALLRVSFFGPFYGDYRVLLLADDYRYALVGSGTDNYLWILSRTPALSDVDKARILDEARHRRYDVSKLIWVKQ